MNEIMSDPSGDLIIERLTKAGYPTYYVGGCVRNCILGLPISDYDITTAAKPDTVKKIFNDCRIFDTGLKHGTVTVVFGGTPFEITTFRKEGKYSDSRHPDKVYFCNDLIEDLRRRDFTCNAMAYSKKQGLIDVFNGYYDTRNHILRAVGTAVTRFKEDALRILRGLRFSSDFGFIPEEKTANAMRKCSYMINNVSRERVYSEINKIFAGEHLYNAIIDFSEILQITLKIENINESAYIKAVKSAVYCTGNSMLKFIVFLYVLLSGNKSEAQNVLNKLKSDNATKIRLSSMFDCAELFLQTVDKNIKNYDYIVKRALATAYPAFEDLYNFIPAIFFDTTLFVAAQEFIGKCAYFCNKGTCIKLSDLVIDGKDVAAAGYTGKEIGRILSDLLEEVMSGELDNNRIILLNRIRKNNE